MELSQAVEAPECWRGLMHSRCDVDFDDSESRSVGQFELVLGLGLWLGQRQDKAEVKPAVHCHPDQTAHSPESR
jgi:hypothetical protein